MQHFYSFLHGKGYRIIETLQVVNDYFGLPVVANFASKEHPALWLVHLSTSYWLSVSIQQVDINQKIQPRCQSCRQHDMQRSFALILRVVVMNALGLVVHLHPWPACRTACEYRNRVV